MASEANAIKNLIDFDELEHLFKDFSNMTGLPIGLIDQETHELLVGIGWRDICRNFFRACPEAEACCIESNKRMMKELKQAGDIHIGRCPHGLIDAFTPIVLEGKLLASLVTGQSLFSPPDEEMFRAQAQKYGFDEEQFLKSLNEVPIVEEKRIRSILEFVSKTILSLLQKNQNLQTVRTANKKQKLLLENIAQLAPVGIGLASERTVVWANRAMSEITGYSQKELENMKCELLYPSHQAFILSGETLNSQLTKDGVSNREVQWKRKDGTFSDVFVSMSCLDGNDCRLEMIFTVVDITEQKKSRRVLKQSEERLSLAARAGHLGLWDWNVLNDEVFYNDQYFTMLGFSPDEFPRSTETWRRLLHPDDQDMVLSKIQSVLYSRNPNWTIEFRMKAASGDFRWIVCQGEVVEFTKDGAPARAIGIHQDVTQRKQDEQKLFESEQRYHELFNKMSSGVAIYSAFKNGEDFIIDDFNAAAQTDTGLTLKDVLGKKLSQVLPHTAPELLESYRRVYKTGNPESLPLVNYQDNSINIWANCYVFSLPTGQIVGIYNDITEQKQSEERLERQKVKLEQIIDLSPEGFFLADHTGTIIQVNQQATVLSGYPVHELIGQNLSILFSAKELKKPPLNLLSLKKGGILIAERKILSKKGIELQVEVNCIMMPDGNLIGFFKSIEDRRTTENLLLRCQSELKKQQEHLHQTNSALQLMSEQAEQRKKDTELNVAANILGLVEPHLNNLKTTKIDEVQANYIKIIESTLKQLTSPFIRTTILMDLKLSPAQLQVANLIKQGKSSKQIAEILSISVQTVDKHRSNIRKKLGVNNKDISLMEVLMSL